MYRTAWFTDKIIDRLIWLESELGGSIRLVAVDDGCPEQSGIKMERRLRDRGRHEDAVVFLSRNFGSHQACRAGLSLSTDAHTVVMAADLQEPEGLILEMFRELESGELDVIVGARSGRHDPLFSRFTSWLFWALYRKMVVKEIPSGGVDMFGCTGDVCATLSRLNESNSNLIGLLFWSGYRRKVLTYKRVKREQGKSGWTFSKRMKLMYDSLFAFTDMPIRLLGRIGFWGILLSLGFAIVIAGSRLLGYITEIGYAGLMTTVLGSTSILLFALSIVGEYVYRTYENGKGRPGFVIRRIAKGQAPSDLSKRQT